MTRLHALAAHEAGHALGMVPNSASAQLRKALKDERFSGISFDGSSSNHAGQNNSNLMAPETIPGMISNIPPILTANPTFRTVERSYLRAILPR